MTAVSPLPEHLIDPSAELELLADGFGFIEGPVWSGDSLYFSDIPESTRYSWDEQRGTRRVQSPTNKGNGMALDTQGGLLVCEHITSRVVRYDGPEDDAEGRPVATHFGDRELNSPNDVACHEDGRIYFTDPIYGRISPRVGLVRDVPLDFRAVFLLPVGAAPHEVIPVARDFDGPNGLCFSPDRRTLYVNDTPRKHIRALRLTEDGTVIGDAVVADLSVAGTLPGYADGMKCDDLGNIWVTGPGGICVFSPEGDFLGTLAVPSVVGNHAWGGHDSRNLYICATDRLFRLRTVVRGDAIPGSATNS